MIATLPKLSSVVHLFLPMVKCPTPPRFVGVLDVVVDVAGATATVFGTKVEVITCRVTTRSEERTRLARLIVGRFIGCVVAVVWGADREVARTVDVGAMAALDGVTIPQIGSELEHRLGGAGGTVGAGGRDVSDLVRVLVLIIST